MAEHNFDSTSGDLAAFYDQIIDLQDRLLELHPRIEAYINEEQMNEFLGKKRFWMQLLPFPLDPVRFNQDYLETAGFIIEARPKVVGSISAISALVGRLPIEELAEKALRLDMEYLAKTAEDGGVPAELFVFMLQNAIRPQIRAWAEGLPKLNDRDNWQQPYCPVCGQEAIISRIRPGDGQRSLFCGHCFTEWDYRHLACPHCGNDEHESINIIEIEGDRFNTIYACNKCRGYVKTLNERHGGKAGNLFTEGARTFYLDMLAEREGYNNRRINKDSFN
ncbi:MAG: formate dehydrogenase accessory protein FdhE [Firmicutes bacterium]|nr:formate dehydrogenase accessory protein FdhE [Bacillota bacterium]